MERTLGEARFRELKIQEKEATSNRAAPKPKMLQSRRWDGRLDGMPASPMSTTPPEKSGTGSRSREPETGIGRLLAAADCAASAATSRPTRVLPSEARAVRISATNR